MKAYDQKNVLKYNWVKCFALRPVWMVLASVLVLGINRLKSITREVVEAARESLVVGTV